MSKRFTRLEAALKYIRPPRGTAVEDAPAGTALRLYQDWKAGKRVIEYTRDEGSNPDRILKVAVNPFGYPAADGNLAIVPISQRASLSAVGAAIQTAANIEENIDLGAQELTGFIPAKATIFAGSGTTTLVANGSEITGIPYRKRNGASFTIPYGRSVGMPTEIEVRNAIKAALVASPNATVSFKSERL